MQPFFVVHHRVGRTLHQRRRIFLQTQQSTVPGVLCSPPPCPLLQSLRRYVVHLRAPKSPGFHGFGVAATCVSCLSWLAS